MEALLTFEKYGTIIYDVNRNEEVYSEYTPVEQKECKKHEIAPMETTTIEIPDWCSIQIPTVPGLSQCYKTTLGEKEWSVIYFMVT